MVECRPIPGIPGGVARRMAHVPLTLPDGVHYSPIGEVASGALLLHAEAIGRFHIYGGNGIDFSVEANATPWAVDHFLWGNALAGLIHQRGELPLHAAALSPCGLRVIVLCGPSGVGKSTMSATLVKRGWRFFSDDLTRITSSGSEVLAWPGAGALRLRSDACERLAIVPSGVIRGRAGDEKFVMDIAPPDDPAPLTAIIELGGQEALPRLELLAGGPALAAVMSNVAGPRKLRALGRLKEHFLLVQEILACCPVFRLHGRSTASAEVLSEIIASELSRDQDN
jgi:hypothetical protein